MWKSILLWLNDQRDENINQSHRANNRVVQLEKELSDQEKILKTYEEENKRLMSEIKEIRSKTKEAEEQVLQQRKIEPVQLELVYLIILTKIQSGKSGEFTAKESKLKKKVKDLETQLTAEKESSEALVSKLRFLFVVILFWNILTVQTEPR